MLDQKTPQPAAEEAERAAERRTNALWISILAFLALAIATWISYGLTAQAENPDFTGTYLAGGFALLALSMAFLAYFKQVTIGSSLLLGSLLLLTIALPYLAAGQVTAPAIASLLIVTAIASATLKSPWNFRIGAASMVVSLTAILLDLFLPPTFGIHSRVIAAVPLSIAFSAIYIYFILRRFAFYSLRVKLLIAFTLVAFIPLAILGLYNNSSTRQNLTERGQIELQNLVTLTATQVDKFVSNQLDSIRISAEQPVLSAFMSQEPNIQKTPAEQKAALDVMQTFITEDPIFIESIGLLNLEGTNVLDTNAKYIGRNELNNDYFLKVVLVGQAFVSNLTFQDQTPEIYFSAPLRDQAGKIIGVIRVEYNGYVLQSLIKPNALQTGLLISLVDSTNFVRMAYSGRNFELHKSIRAISDQQMKEMQVKGLLPKGQREDAIAPADDMLSGLVNIKLLPFFNVYSNDLGEQTLSTAASLQNVDWVVVASRSESALFAPLRVQARALALIALGLIFVVALSSLFASRILMEPISDLTTVTERIASGHLTARAHTTTQDEIGTLANAFNNMTYQLRQALTGLEGRVRDRTADLEKSRAQSEGRALKLQAISDVSRVISSEQKLENLLPLITQLVSEKFGFYHVGIFLVDPTHRYAILRATNSEGGQRMLARSHRLEVGQTGIVGYVTGTGKPRIALDVGADAVFFNNPDLPETRSEMALPLSIRGETIGALDVQSTQSGAFTEDDINTLSIMADQIAVAIENANLFGRTEQALEEVRALYSQYLRQEWQAFAKQENKIGYHQTLAGGKLIEEPVENEHIRMVLEEGQSLVLDSRNSQGEPGIVVPVKLRGETIGVLNISSPQQSREWSQDELNLVQAVSDRLALALENARLLQDSLRRAAKEQKIGQVTTRIGATINMRNMLQTAVEELGRALPGSDVVIQFQQSGNGAAKNRMSK